jgi:transcription elongation factor GreB
MSRAFVKEDVDPPERSTRRRSASGLPPGATNYITARGARRLQEELDKLTATQSNSECATELQQIVASLQIVTPPEGPLETVVFGSTVTLRDKESGNRETYTILGVDELDLAADAVSWISPIGKALLGADLGATISFEKGRFYKVDQIEYLLSGERG